MKYYCYRHIRLDKNVPFYIGIGVKPKKYKNKETEYKRAYNFKTRNNLWHKIYNNCNKNIDIEILFETDSLETIYQKEQEFIKLYGRIVLNSGPLSNLTDGGEGFVGLIKTKQHIKKISKSLMNHSLTEETKKKIKESVKEYAKNNPATKEIREKISLNLIGKLKGVSFKDRTNIHYNVIMKKISKPIQKYSLDDCFIEEFVSLTEASKSTGVSITDICTCAKGRQKTAKGFKWKYKC